MLLVCLFAVRSGIILLVISLSLACCWALHVLCVSVEQCSRHLLVYLRAPLCVQPAQRADRRPLCMPLRAWAMSTASDDRDSREGSFSRSSSQLMMVPIVASSMPVRMTSTSLVLAWDPGCSSIVL